MIVERKEFKVDDGEVGWIEAVFDSGNILKTTYFPERELLYIAFSRGDTYSYGNVSPELYEEFEQAESRGKFFHQRLNNKNKHPVRREFSLYPTEVQGLRKIIEEKSDRDEEE